MTNIAINKYLDEVQLGQRRAELTMHAERRGRERFNKTEDLYNPKKSRLVIRGGKVVTAVSETYEIGQKNLYKQRQWRRHFKQDYYEALERLRMETVKLKVKKKLPLFPSDT